MSWATLNTCYYGSFIWSKTVHLKQVSSCSSKLKKLRIYQSFRKKIIACYKNLASRSWPVLFTLTYIFLIQVHSPVLLKNRIVVAILLSSENKWSLILVQWYYDSILVWGLVSVWLTITTHCLYYTPC